MQHIADGLDQQRFGQARHAHQQHVALAEHCSQYLLDNFRLADDDLAQFVAHRFVGAGKLLDGIKVGGGMLDAGRTESAIDVLQINNQGGKS